MKKTLIAVAALAATGAFAQVSVYGRLDVGYAQTKTTDGADTVKANGVQSHNSASSYWGVKGEEDLGGGLKAMFKLEQDVYVANGNTGTSGSSGGATGSAAFNRTSLVGLSGAFGTVALGRDYIPTFKLAAATDVMGQSRIGAVQLSGAVGSTRPNLVHYSTPNMSGFQANIAYGNQDTTDSTDAGDTSTKVLSATATYTNGPLMVGVGTGSVEVKDAGAAAGTQAYFGVTLASGVDKSSMNMIAASYNFGTFKLVGNVINAKATTATSEAKASEMNIGATMPMGKVTLAAQYGTNKAEVTGVAEEWDGNDFIVGVDYALSAKTSLFAKTGTYNKLSGNGDDLKQSSTAVGIRTVF